MSGSISKRVRSVAIAICELDGPSQRECAESIGNAEGAVTLATEAMAAVVRIGIRVDDDVQFHEWREAGGLLRDGWSPGDPVVRRGGGS